MDDEYQQESSALLRMAAEGKVTLIISDILIRELELVPEEVQAKLRELPENCLEIVSHSEETKRLRDKYLEDQVVGEAQIIDAHHVAIATVSRADVIVSWNFRHIVHFEKIRGFNAVNLQEGYAPIEIRSPREVV